MLFRIVRTASISMKLATHKANLLIAGLVLLASCSTDPNKQKLKYLRSGDSYFEKAKYQEAVIEFRNALEIDSRLAAAHYQLGRTYLALKNPDSAYREMNECVTLDPGNSDAQLHLASLMMARGQFGQAQSVAQKVLSTQPANVWAHTILGETLYPYPRLSQRPSRSFKRPWRFSLNASKTTALWVRPTPLPDGSPKPNRPTGRLSGPIRTRPKPTCHWASFIFRRRNMAQAETEMRAACDLDPHALAPRLFLARIYLAAGKSADAEKLYADLKTIAPDNPQAYQALGKFYVSSGQKDKAVAEFRSVLAAHPKDNSVKGQLVEILLDLNRPVEAVPLNRGGTAREPRGFPRPAGAGPDPVLRRSVRKGQDGARRSCQSRTEFGYRLLLSRSCPTVHRPSGSGQNFLFAGSGVAAPNGGGLRRPGQYLPRRTAITKRLCNWPKMPARQTRACRRAISPPPRP